MKLRAFPALIAALLLAGGMALPRQAFAFGMPTQQCAHRPIMEAPPTLAALPERSRLEIMRMQQEAGFLPQLLTNALIDKTPPCLSGAIRAFSLPQALQQPIAEPAGANDRPDVFGSIALSVEHTPLDAKWRAVGRAQLSSRTGPWASLIKSILGLSRTKQLGAVNEWVNARVRFTDDLQDSRGADRWSGATETLRRNSGDCEDYAIAKMKLLEAAGIDRADMYLVIAKDLVRRADHAVLVVRLDQRLILLDNSTDELLDAQEASDYRPIFSYGASGAWTHGYAEKPVRIAAVAGAIANAESRFRESGFSEAGSIK